MNRLNLNSSGGPLLPKVVIMVKYRLEFTAALLLKREFLIIHDVFLTLNGYVQVSLLDKLSAFDASPELFEINFAAVES